MQFILIKIEISKLSHLIFTSTIKRFIVMKVFSKTDEYDGLSLL
jgi:hypothetical protein